MEYLSTTQIAGKWNISSRRIQILCNEGRIPGAMKVGPTWVIPKDAQKPDDQRIKNSRYEIEGVYSFLKEDDVVYQVNSILPQEKTLNTVRGYIINAQKQVYSAVNSAMVTAYWNIGKQIFEACGENDRAAYGKQLLHFLSEKLTAEFGKGYDERNLRNMRQFYLAFPIWNALRPELSWTHYRSLMKVTDEMARNFYLEEAVKAGWSARQLERQINSFYYQRILTSKDKKRVSAEIETLEPKPEYECIIKDPYVLEFLNLPANEHFYESELEQALINHLQKFLLGLGRGYSFVARQKHFVVDNEHFYVTTQVF